MTDGRERVRSVLSQMRIGVFLLSPSACAARAAVPSPPRPRRRSGGALLS